VILQAYIDDSGTKNDGPLMVITAIIGPAQAWAEVSDAWDRELRFESGGRIAYFKEDEAVHLTGEFRHWREEARDRKVQRLAKIVNRPDLFAAWYGVDLDSHQSASRFAGKPYTDMKRHGGNQPYLLLMPTVMMAAAVAARDRVPNTQRLELILDEQNVFRQDINAMYRVMLEAVTMVPGVKEIMPNQPWFRDDKEFLPLQAADLMAGTIRRMFLADPKRLLRGPELSAVKIWPNSKVLGGDDMFKFAQAHTKERLVSVQKPRLTRKGVKKR
jgi:Protein of unknown function (DUF3800)